MRKESGNIIKYRLPCDNCGSSDAKVRYEAGDTFCFSCNTAGDMQNKSTGYAPEENDVTEFQDKGKPDFGFYYEGEYKAIKDRRIDADTCKKYGVRTNDKGHLMFPRFNKEGEMIGVKIRLYPEKDFRSVGVTKGSVPFGMQAFPKTGRSITVTEGELDAMAAYKMTGSKYCNISIWDGAGSAKRCMKDNFEAMKEFESIVLNFDADKPGREATQDVGPMFPGRTKIMELTEGKDACDYLKANKTTKYVDEFHRAKRFTLGGIINGADTWEKYKEKKNIKSIPWDPQYEELNKKTYGIRLGEIVLITAGTGSGKCFAKGTEVLMYDGTRSLVEDVTVGEQVMGHDSKPRNVLSLGRGRETMYEIKGTDGTSYTVNKSHILSIVYKDKVMNLSVEEYLSKSEFFKSRSYGYRKAVDFLGGSVVEINIDPYWLGLWLGDGDSRDTRITNIDPEIIHSIVETANSIGHTCSTYAYEDRAPSYAIVNKQGTNVYLKFLRDNCLLRNKHIPERLFASSLYNRRRILAGLIDSDGYLGKGNTYEIVQKREGLALDIQRLARSVGLRATITYKEVEGTTYSRVWISGNLKILPVKVERKKVDMDYMPCYASLKYNFDVIEKDVDDYYGFELDGDHLFFLSDYTVVHNTQVLREWKYHLLRNTMYNIMDISLEEDVGDTIGGLMAIHANKRIHLPDVDISETEERKLHTDLYGTGQFTLLDHEGSVGDDSLLDKMEYAATVDNCKIQFLDHITIAVSDCEAGSENLTMDKFMNRLLKMVKRLNICVIVVSHLRKVGGGGKSFEEGRVPTEDDLKGSGSLKQIAMTTIAIARNKYAETEVERNTTSFHVLKCRFSGRTGPADYAFFDDETGRMVVIDPEEAENADNQFKDETLGF